jgi:Flp pilus assembly protein TadB
MTALLPALFGAMTAAGAVGMTLALRPAPERTAAPRPTPAFAGRLAAMTPRARRVLLGSTAIGLLTAALTGWLVAVVIVPAAAVGLPLLLSPPPTAERINRVEAMEEWTRSLAGVLGGGVGLEQALTATLRSTPEPIRAEVTALVARLRARWDTDDALRAFADDLNDATGDLVAANLLLAARRRNRSLAAVLHGVAESVADDVAARRRIESGRAKPRGTARLVTLITAAVLAVLALTGTYIEPYGSPVGQVTLAVLLGAYVAGLVWLRRMAQGTPLPRFLGATARERAR